MIIKWGLFLDQIQTAKRSPPPAPLEDAPRLCRDSNTFPESCGVSAYKENFLVSCLWLKYSSSHELEIITNKNKIEHLPWAGITVMTTSPGQQEILTSF